MLISEVNIIEKLPMYRTCGIRLGSHLRAVATAMTLLFLSEWSKLSKNTNRRIWQLPLTGLLHDIGLASPRYQESLMHKCLKGEEPHSHRMWIHTVSILSYASCSIGPTSLRRALGDSARAIAKSFTKRKHLSLSDLNMYVSNIDKKDELQDPASYTYLILSRHSSYYGIPPELAEAFRIKSFSASKISRCISRTLALKSTASNRLGEMLNIADELVMTIENAGLNISKADRGQLYRRLLELGINNPWSMVKYVQSRIQKFYTAFSAKGGAAC